MKKVSLREYAKMYKLSYFTVMKMVRAKELKSITIEENGKEVPYVLLEEEATLSSPMTEPIVHKEKVSLEEENKALKLEIEQLKRALDKCNKRTILASS
ncbi:MAG: Unknown protein [uncultured Sulfurovum sp.]|uniref:Uncharacterized protein n=1 Tax=uncultured Sulfurovum sp. TaxID=269237 RepID=A0A6S6SSR7_9BACT|nr:MAG: Unknown protein [uncultured Sulfurovum sp.]